MNYNVLEDITYYVLCEWCKSTTLGELSYAEAEKTAERRGFKVKETKQGFVTLCEKCSYEFEFQNTMLKRICEDIKNDTGINLKIKEALHE